MLGIKQAQNNVTEVRYPYNITPNQSSGQISCNMRKSEIFKNLVIGEIAEEPFWDVYFY